MKSELEEASAECRNLTQHLALKEAIISSMSDRLRRALECDSGPHQELAGEVVGCWGLAWDAGGWGGMLGGGVLVREMGVLGRGLGVMVSDVWWYWFVGLTRAWFVGLTRAQD